jgi:hypothetical protein
LWLSRFFSFFFVPPITAHLPTTTSARYKFVAVALLKWLRNGRFTCGFRSETTTWIQKWLKKSVGASRKL